MDGICVSGKEFRVKPTLRSILDNVGMLNVDQHSFMEFGEYEACQDQEEPVCCSASPCIQVANVPDGMPLSGIKMLLENVGHVVYIKAKTMNKISAEMASISEAVECVMMLNSAYYPGTQQKLRVEFCEPEAVRDDQ